MVYLILPQRVSAFGAEGGALKRGARTKRKRQIGARTIAAPDMYNYLRKREHFSVG